MINNNTPKVYKVMGAAQYITFELANLTCDYDIFMLWSSSYWTQSMIESHFSDSDDGWRFFYDNSIYISSSDPDGPKARSINSGTSPESFQRYLVNNKEYHVVICSYYHDSGSFKYTAKPSNSAIPKSMNWVNNEKTNQNIESVPKLFRLYEAYPNPFNPNTTINFDIQFESKVTITIFDVKGRQIKNLLSNFQGAGAHSVVWDGTNDNGTSMPSGTYFCKFNSSGYTNSIKLLLLK